DSECDEKDKRPVSERHRRKTVHAVFPSGSAWWCGHAPGKGWLLPRARVAIVDMMRFSFLFRCRVNRRTGSREGIIGGRPTRIPWSWTPPALASSRAPHRRAPGFRSSAVVVGMLGLSPCRRTREGPVQKEAPHPLDAQLTIRRVISEVGPPPG